MNHIVPTLPYFLKSVSSLGKIAVVIPKGSFKNDLVFDSVSRKYKVFKPDELKEDVYKIFTDKNNVFNTRAYLRENWKSFIETYVEADCKFLIIDIGGYFASCFFSLIDQYKDNFIGVVEDTENGN